MLANIAGSAHEEAVRVQGSDSTSQDEPAANAIPIPTLTSPQAGHLGLEEEGEGFPSEDLLETLVSSENQLLSMTCGKVVLAYSVPGTLVLTETSIAFTADDTSSEYEKSLCMVSDFVIMCSVIPCACQ
jgi:hypothetical protein